LKSRLKTMWEAGDFSKVAQHIEQAAREFVGGLEIKPGMKVLDVACGSGNLALLAAERGAEVTGIDIAENLVNTAKRRAAKTGLEIKFEQGDAESMPYEDNTFDLVMSMFGAMFCPRPEVTASELIRVCQPGGTIAMANWTPTGFTGQMFKLSTKYLPPPNMPPPVQWGDPEVVRERLAGVSDIKTTARIAEMTFDFPPEGVVEFFKTYFGPTVMTFKTISEEDQEALTSDMVDLWATNNQATDGTTRARGEYLEVIAIK
ncbi:MAG TPA: class I SAM-dependent methyltransferase, partial [Pyrinomonadaceae bacterium]|nr:class I SAM-dependent methyltransferase [Pyrinomonadaceae bacterium]